MSKRKKELTKKQMLNSTFYTLSIIQFLGTTALFFIISQTPNLKTNGFDDIIIPISVSTFYSIIIVSVAWIIYGLSRIKKWIDELDSLFICFFLLLLLIASVAAAINFKIDIIHWFLRIDIIYWLSCRWISTVPKIILCLISIGCCATSITLLDRT